MKRNIFGIALWKPILVGSFLASAIVAWALWPQEVKHVPEKKIIHSVKFLNASQVVARKELKKLTLDQKIGQLIMIKADTAVDSSSIAKWIKDYHIGGLMFNGLTAGEVEHWSSYARSLAEKPIFISTENVLANEPKVQELTLASISSDSLALKYISEKVSSLKVAGINIAFRDCLSLDTIPDSTTGYNMFQNADSALSKKSQFVAACESQHILAGVPDFAQEYTFDTTKSTQPIRSLYSSLFKNGLPAMRLDITQFAEDLDIRGALKEAGFEGLLFCDGEYRSPGNDFDVLIAASEPIKLISRIKEELKNKKISEQKLDEATIKVLKAKKWLSPKKKKKIERRNADYFFSGGAGEISRRRLLENTTIVLKNKNNALPINRIYNNSLLVVTIGDPVEWTFTNRCRFYHPAWGQEHNPKNLPSLPKLSFEKLKWHTPLVITMNNVEIDTARDQEFIESLNKLSTETDVILCHFGNPKNLQHLYGATAIIHTNETDKLSMDIMAQIIFGGATATGKLPVTVSDSLPAGTSFPLLKRTRLKYTIPEESGINTDSLDKIDAIVREAIRYRATPGCQVMIAHKGNVIFDKSYGYHTYKRRHRVGRNDMYDLSSVTKVFSTTLAIMKLYDEKSIKLNHNLRKYFKRELDTLAGCKVKKVQLENLLLHKSGLQSYMPIVRYIQDEDSLFRKFDRYFCDRRSDWYKYEMAEDLYLRKDVPDSIWLDMKKVRVRNDTKYIYSDLNFNLLQKVIEKRTGKSLDDYSRRQFYIPLGLQRTMYNPLDRMDEKHIVPTEDDKKWRKQLVHGYVHDQSAALMGGVAGNAGLFSTAHDLTIMGQMLLNGGTYGGKRFFKSSTVKKFTEKAESSHRGLGFNKPFPPKMKFIAPSADHDSYGHTGFAGTCVWVDPKNEIVFVFLSNRIHPKINNWKLNTMRVRSRIHQVIYDCLGISNEEKVEELEELASDTTEVVPEELKSDE